MAESGSVQLVQSKEAWEMKLKEALGDGKLIVSIFAAAWCRPCRSFTPHLQALAVKHPDTLFLKVDVDDMPVRTVNCGIHGSSRVHPVPKPPINSSMVEDLADEYDIQAMPTFVFLKNGKRIDRFVGANLPSLQRKLAHHTTS